MGIEDKENRKQKKQDLIETGRREQTRLGIKQDKK
jgi:hypothetical protein